MGSIKNTEKHSNNSELAKTREVGRSLEEIVHLTNTIGMEYANAKKTSDRYDLLKPSYRARAMEKYDDGMRTETKIRRLAETDQDYLNFLEKFSEAKAQTEKLRIRYESYKNLFEARRSVLSYKKAEMNLI